jgi:hypothetical protein
MAQLDSAQFSPSTFQSTHAKNNKLGVQATIKPSKIA